MGKRLIQQARGKGSPTYKAPSFRFQGAAKVRFGDLTAEVKDFVKCQGHSAPLAVVSYSDRTIGLMIAPEGIRIGDRLGIGGQATVSRGHTLSLQDIPEGTIVCNIEAVPGDGGKFIRTSGTFGRIGTKTKEGIQIIMPSRGKKTFNPKCRATIGIVAGGGRVDKPFLKAGKRFHRMKIKNKLYPIIGGSAQNAVDHPFGNKRTSRKSKARPVPKNAPPGRKVGYLRPKRTGRKKGKKV